LANSVNIEKKGRREGKEEGREEGREGGREVRTQEPT
jgi:hypothetical protein